MRTPEELIRQLQEYIPDLGYRIEKTTITLFGCGDAGFDIVIYFHRTESMIFFGEGGHHIHFADTEHNAEELVLLLVNALAGQVRIVAYSWNGKPRRFVLDELDEDEETWNPVAEMRFPSWKFWLKHAEVTSEIKINAYALRED